MKRHAILPIVIGIYAAVMAYMGRAQFFNPSTRNTYLLTVIIEALVIIGLYFFLRRRDRLRRERRDRESSAGSNKQI